MKGPDGFGETGPRSTRNLAASPGRKMPAGTPALLTGYAVRGIGPGSLVPQWPQFDQIGSTAWPHCGHVGFSDVPQLGQKANFDKTLVLQCGQVLGIGSRRMKYKMTPIASGRKIASSVHIT